ncbi:hypothetical protein EHI47_02880 [Rhizobium leguminosarum]|uniref:Uncharacterized protein n=1 Tax=Rhizobium leguminosarum TaxID=384 RepID=A0A444IC25_RHILE|nr:hypothetical protein EHI47_02880 [Rhizobium leguminosarum]TAU45833.1 hypothetical protein ELI43_26345 [Rhizobium leguminosarum]TBC89828.1 hypothetical protein ELH26_27770 [Rhizobium leguminosarum]
MYTEYTISISKIHNDAEQSVAMRVRHHFKALSRIGVPRRQPSRSFPGGLSWQVCENFCAVEVDAALCASTLIIRRRSLAAGKPVHGHHGLSRCPVAAVLSESAGSALPEHFRFLSGHGNALFCFYAIPDAKPLRTFAGNCFSRSRGQDAALLGGPGGHVVHEAGV